MNEIIRLRQRQMDCLSVSLKDPTLADGQSLMYAQDQPLLSLRRQDLARGTFEFETAGLLCLSDFLGQAHFDREQAYGFLLQFCQALRQVVCILPVILLPGAVFLSPSGEKIYFCAVPLKLEAWMERQKDLHELFRFLLSGMKSDALELQGWLWQISEGPLVDLETAPEQIEKLHVQYCRKLRLFQSKIQPFCLDPPLVTQAVRSVPYPVDQVMEPLMIADEDPPWQAQKTVLLEEDHPARAWLETNGQRCELCFEQALVGRSKQCDIVLEDPSVSMEQARITCSQERFYIQDLKSANGTWLDGKKVIRKMRLKNGMKITFGKQEAVFLE